MISYVILKFYQHYFYDYHVFASQSKFWIPYSERRYKTKEIILFLKFFNSFLNSQGGLWSNSLSLELCIPDYLY